MRNVFPPQMNLGQTGIADIQIGVSSWDDIPVILLGLQHIYTNPSLKEAVFKILEEVAPTKKDNGETKVVSFNKGCPGMDRWSILVLGSLRVGLNTDHDRILELANQHRTLREMLGLGCFDVDKRYCLQTLKDNLDTDLHTFSRHAERQIDQIRRRALQGEAIPPHAEKVFSLFQPHTEWISKGKACPEPCRRTGVPVELGLRVCIREDSHGFILHSLVMQKTADDKVAVPMVKATQALFPSFKACSFDKAFHGPDNQK